MRAGQTKRWLGPAMFAAFGVCALLGLVIVGLAALDSGSLNGLLCRAFQAKTHRTLQFRRLDFHLLQQDPTIVVDDLRIGSPPQIAQGELARIGHGTFHVRLLPLLVGHVTLTGADVSDLDVHMVRVGPGRNNYSFGGAGLSPALRAVKRLVISRATVDYRDPQRQLTLHADVDYDSGRGAVPLHLKGGGVDHGEPYQVDAKAAPLTGRGLNQPYAFQAKMIDGVAKIDFEGATQKPFDFRYYDLAIRGSGPNLADLGYLFGVGVPSTPPFALSAHVTHHNHVVTFQHIVGRLGGSALEGDFISDHSQPKRRLTATVRASVLTAEDLAVVFSPRPPHAETRSQPGAASHVSREPAQKAFDLAAMHDLNAVLDLTSAKVTGYPAPLANVRLHFQLQDGRLDIHPFQAALSPGRLSASFSAQPGRNGLDTRAEIVLQDAALAQSATLQRVGGVLDGKVSLTGAGRSRQEVLGSTRGVAAFRLRGGTLKRSQAAALAGDPFAGAWAALTAKSATVALTCAKGRFDVTGGVLRPSDLVIATSEGEAVGRGSIDLAGQRIDLTLEPVATGGARPVMNAPIQLTGALQHPKVKVDIGHAAKGSGLNVVGALLTAPFRGQRGSAPPTPCPAPF